MQGVEIRYRKRTLLPALILMSIAAIVISYYIFLSGKYDGGTIWKLVYVLLMAGLAATVYRHARKIYSNEPVLIFSTTEFTINEPGVKVSLLWPQILFWKIEKEDNTSYLYVDTADEKRKVNISWLDKTPEEIESLMSDFLHRV